MNGKEWWLCRRSCCGRGNDLNTSVGKENRKFGVAFLAKTIYAESRRVDASAGEEYEIAGKLRFQPLQVSPGTALMAVLRVATPRGMQAGAFLPSNQAEAAYLENTAKRVAREIVETASLPEVQAVQILTTANEHPF